MGRLGIYMHLSEHSLYICLYLQDILFVLFFFLTVWMGGKDLYFCRSDLSHSIHLLCCAKLLVSNVCKLAYAYSSGWCLGVVLHSITVYHQGLETDRVTNRPRSLQFHEQERQIGNNNVTTHHKTLENIYEE